MPHANTLFKQHCLSCPASLLCLTTPELLRNGFFICEVCGGLFAWLNWGTHAYFKLRDRTLPGDCFITRDAAYITSRCRQCRLPAVY